MNVKSYCFCFIVVRTAEDDRDRIAIVDLSFRLESAKHMKHMGT
jgi:hypothetical protein